MMGLAPTPAASPVTKLLHHPLRNEDRRNPGPQQVIVCTIQGHPVRSPNEGLEGILFSHKNKQSMDTRYNRKEPWERVLRTKARP